MADATAAELRAHRASLRAFGTLVDAMRGIAASRLQKARQLLDGADAYAATLRSALKDALRAGAHVARDTHFGDAADPARPALWLVFGAENALDGGYSRAVLSRLPAGARFILWGSHAMRAARASGLEPESTAPLVARAASAIEAADRLQGVLNDALARKPASAVELLFGELVPHGHGHEVRHERLLPLDPSAPERDGTTQDDEPPRMPPLIHLASADLMRALIQEHVSTRLTRAILHSHATENLARLHAMASAHDNVGRMAEQLEAKERLMRQEGITAEVIELAAGLARPGAT